jgi:sugar/nucleoside kinase (ribokinase family)
LKLYQILKLLKREKVEILGKQSKEKSGYSIILDSKEHDRTILSYKGLNNKISMKDIKIQKINTSWIYYSSLLEKSFQTQKKLAKKLYKQGIKIAFNPSEYLIRRKNINSLLKKTEILILNKEEAQILSRIKKNKKELAKKLYKRGPKLIVITDKDKETIAYDGKIFYNIKPNKKLKVKERTGAGDAFAAGFVGGIIANKSIKNSLRLGLKESESVIKYFGAKNKLLKRKLK